MAYSARIDELEKKFSENARRYFAPLANEYRKAGDLDRAIEICRAHLPQQPGHMSGHIVYGQALYESRQLDEAKTVFEAALALDPENLIALRHLGDIARDGGDAMTARSWYMRVLDADPRNDDVAALLAELDAAPVAAAAEAPAAEGASGWGDINPERGADDTVASPVEAGADGNAGTYEATAGSDPRQSGAPQPAADAVIEPEPDQSSTIGMDVEAASDASPSRGSQATGGEAPGGRDREESHPAPPAASGPSLDRLLDEAYAADADTQEMDAATGLASAAFARPESAEGVIAPSGNASRTTPAEPTALGEGALAEVDALFDEIASDGPPEAVGGSPRAAQTAPPSGAGRSGAASPGALEALFGDVAGADPDSKSAGDAGRLDGLETSEFVAPSRVTPEPARAARGTTGSMAVSGLTSFEQPSEEDSSTRAAFVTETMAELYLQQGFTSEALDIYRQLLEQNPGDTNLRDRIAQLERGGPTSLSVAAVSSEVIQAAQQRHAARPVRTARAFFGRLAGHQVGANPDDATASAFAAETSEEERASQAAWEPDGAASEAAAEAFQPAANPGGRSARSTAPGIPVVSDLFGDTPVSEEDEAAASMLASAFSSFSEPAGASEAPASRPAGAASGPTGRPARAAGRELSLDQVFRDSDNRPGRKSGPVSFDQFFSDGSQGTAPETPAGSATPASQEAQDPEGDLEQFTAWLEGLKRK